MVRVAVIGFGDFARLMVKELAPYFDIVVSTRLPPEDSKNYKCRFVSREEALSQDYIIPSMPSQFLEDFFRENKKLVNPESLVIDVCSVKVKPIEVLNSVLPPTCGILATHPMFGPSSAANGIEGKPMMVHPTRVPDEQYRRIKKFLSENLRLKVIEVTPEEHDQRMAYVQGLSHYIGKAMQVMGIPETELATRAYDDLYDMKQVQGSDSWELFESIMFENPYALKVNKEFKDAIKQLDKKLGIL